jgi:hypothetical protein
MLVLINILIKFLIFFFSLINRFSKENSSFIKGVTMISFNSDKVCLDNLFLFSFSFSNFFFLSRS